jgi:hypothetical protein
MSGNLVKKGVFMNKKLILNLFVTLFMSIGAVNYAMGLDRLSPKAQQVVLNTAEIALNMAEGAFHTGKYSLLAGGVLLVAAMGLLRMDYPFKYVRWNRPLKEIFQDPNFKDGLDTIKFLVALNTIPGAFLGLGIGLLSNADTMEKNAQIVGLVTGTSVAVALPVFFCLAGAFAHRG